MSKVPLINFWHTQAYRFIFIKDITGDQQLEKVFQAHINLHDSGIAKNRSVHFVEGHDLSVVENVKQSGSLKIVLSGG